MKFPWVSRERLDEAHRRIVELEAERRELLDRLLDREPSPRVSVEEDKSNVTAFSTPFDRIGSRFDRLPAADKARFRARMR